MSEEQGLVLDTNEPQEVIKIKSELRVRRNNTFLMKKSEHNVLALRDACASKKSQEVSTAAVINSIDSAEAVTSLPIRSNFIRNTFSSECLRLSECFL
jgi:hypothetical protein